MSESVAKLMPTLLSVGHKCKYKKCKQIAEEFDLMKKFILYSNQLNIYYKNVLNSLDNTSDDAIDMFLTQKQTLLDKIESENKSIDKTFWDIISDTQESDLLKIKSTNITCDLCRKRFPDKQLTTHLAEHLDKIFDTKSVDNTIDENINETNIEFDFHLNQFDVQSVDVLNQMNIKLEPIDVTNNESVLSANIGSISDNISSSDEDLPKSRRKKSKVKERLDFGVKIRKNGNRSGNSKFRCEECDKRLSNERALNLHISQVHSITHRPRAVNTCEVCDYRTGGNGEFKKHMIEEHNIDPELTKSHECQWPDCGLKFSYNTTLDRHFRSHSANFQFTCEWPGCARIFEKEKRLTEHMRVHTGEKPFQCDWPGCGRSFGQRCNYRSHLLTHDKSKVRKHVCHYPECGRSYEFRKLLQQHIFSVHEKDNKPFRCTYIDCPSSFVSKQAMNIHIDNVHNKFKFCCSVETCHRYFYEKEGLDRHLERCHKERKKRTIVSNSDKEYKKIQCDWPGCEFEARHPFKIEMHKMRAHTGERPFKCIYPCCSFTTLTKSMLQFHEMRSHTGERPFKCHYPGCEFGAVRNFELKCHLLKHTGETPFPCEFPNCGKRFKSQRALDTHSAKTHLYQN